MIKTVDLTGTEAKVSDLGGQNVAVKNLSAGTIYASIYPDITAGADNVVEIPAGGGEVVLDAGGTVYLLGTGRVQCTGTDYATPNFKQPSQSVSGGGGGTSDVTKAYVDAQDNTNLGAAKAYTDTAINAVMASVSDNSDSISALQSAMTTAQADIAENTAAAEAAQAAADTNAANITTTAAETLAAAKSYTDIKANALDTRVTANENAINTLNGTGDGSVKKAVSDGIAAVVADAPEDFDTLKEISAWIDAHADSAAAMNSQIQSNTSDITNLETNKADKSEIGTGNLIINYSTTTDINPLPFPVGGGGGESYPANLPEDITINIQDTHYALIGGATEDDPGRAGLVPAPPAGSTNCFLSAKGGWENPLEPKNITEKNTNLDNYMASGLYYFDSNHTPLNVPTSINGWLLVMTAPSGATKQIWFRQGTPGTNDYQTSVRSCDADGPWSEWRRFAMVTELTASTAAYGANQEQAAEIMSQLEELDAQSVRSLRAVAAGAATDEDTDKLREIETQAAVLRAELAELGGGE